MCGGAGARWAGILLNWINCYDAEVTEIHQLLTGPGLTNILNKLYCNLDSSLNSSSIDTPPSLDHFVIDKYPEFIFENGTSQPTTEDDASMAASLLLFYMCVRSKDVDLKNAMCSKLSRADQEVILKFTKCLMGRTPVTYGDVRAAVIESCGPDSFPCIPGADMLAGSTPPPLRALHGEVRRLRAALDAERFDRLYLQDELTATSAKVEKLLKDKEKNQKEIVSLKAQLSAGATELETSQDGSPTKENHRKVLARQLSCLEERLVDTQGRLDECERERDLYKAKIEEIKLDREKWIQLGQQESVRACALSEQLETERKTSGSLRELLAELQAHQKLNSRENSSMLEWDDMDNPERRSFHDSVCGDLCASVVEVQLCEERARIAHLTQQLQALDDKVKGLEKNQDEVKTAILKQRDLLQNQIKESEVFCDNNDESLEEIIKSLNLTDFPTETIDIDFNAQPELERNIDISMKLHALLSDLVRHLKSDIDNKMDTINEQKKSLFNTEKLLQSATNNQSKIIYNVESEMDTYNKKDTTFRNQYNKKLDELETQIDSLKRLIHIISDHLSIKMKEKDNYIESLNRSLEKESKEKIVLEMMIADANFTCQASLEERNNMIKTLQIHLNQEKALREESVKEISVLKDHLKCQNVTTAQIKENMDKEMAKKSAEIELLEHRIEILHSTINSNNVLLSQQEAKISNDLLVTKELYDKYLALEDAKNNLYTEINEKTATIISLRDTKINQEKSLEVKEGIINKLRKQYEEMEIDKKLKEKDIEIKTQESNNLINSLNNQLSELEQNAVEMEATMAKKLEKNIALVDSLYNEIEEKAAIILKLETTNRELKEKLESEVGEKTEIVNEKENIKMELEKYKIETDNIILKIQSKLSQQHELKSHILEIKESLEIALHSQESQLSDVIEKLQNEVNKNMLLLSCINEELQSEKCKNEALPNDFAEHKIEKNNDISVLNDEICALQQTLKETINLKQILEVKESLQIALHSQESRLSDAIEKLQNEVNKNMLLLSCIKEELQSEKCNNEALSNDFAELKIKKNNDISVLNDEICALQQTLKETINLKQSILDEKLSIEKQLQSKESLLTQNKEQLQAETKRNDDLSNELKKVKISEKALNEELKAKKSIISELDHKLKSAGTEKQSLEKENFELLQNIKDKERLITKSASEFNLLKELHTRVATKKTSLEAQVSEKNKAISDLNNILIEKSSAIATLEIEKSQIHSLITGKEAVATDISDKLAQKTIENEGLLKEANLIKEKLLNCEIFILELTEKVEIEQRAKQIINDRYTNDINEIKKIVGKKLSELKFDGDMFIKGEHDIASDERLSENELQDTEDVFEFLTNEFDAAYKDKESKVSKLGYQIQTLQSEIIEKSNKIQELDNKIKQNIILIDTLELNIANLKCEINANAKEYQTICKAREDQDNIFTKLVKEYDSKMASNSILIDKLQNESLQFKTESEEIQRLYDETKIIRDQLEAEYKNYKININEVVEILQTNNCTLDKEITSKSSEIAKLMEEKTCIQVELDHANKQLKLIRSYIRNILSSEEQIDGKLIDVDNLSNEEVTEFLINYVSRIINLHKTLVVENNYFEKNITELQNEKEIVNEKLSNLTKKLQVILLQNSRDLEKITQDTDLFDTKYQFVDVNPENFNIANNNDNLDDIVEKLLLRYKNIAIIFKTELDSLSSIHKQVLKEKENITAEIISLKIDYERNIINLNDQLSDKKALVCHLEKDINLMQEDKGTIIKSLTDQLEKEKMDSTKILNEYYLQINELKLKLEKDALQKEKEVADKENLLKALEDKLDKKEKIIAQNVSTEDFVRKFKIYITNFTEELHLTCVSIGLADNEQNSISSDFTSVNLDALLKHSVNTKTATRPLCDEEKIQKSSNNSISDLASLEIDFQKMMKKGVLVIKGIQDATVKLKAELENNEKLNSKICANNKLVQTLENEVGNLELQLEEIKEESEKVKEQAKELTDHLETKKVHLEYTQTKLTEMENVITEKESENLKLKKIVTDLNNNLLEVTNERDNLIVKSEKGNAAELIVEEFKKLIDIFDSDDNVSVDKLLQEIKEVESRINKTELSSLEAKLRNLCYLISDLKDRNKELTAKCEELELEKDSKIKTLTKEVAALSKSIAHREDLVNHAKVDKENEKAEMQMQIEILSSDLIGTSEERNQTISNLEKIVYDKNRTITTLQTEITYLKNLIADSGNKVLDITKELEDNRETCHQLSAQLKRSIFQKNEEINDLKKQLLKLSSNEINATQIIKVSAKYQAMILKRIAEIKSTTVLRELTHLNNIEADKRKSVAIGAITMDELESFLESTEKHLRKLTEKQTVLQKERDCFAEVSKINESETISLKKYLTELLAHFKTFSSIKDVYNQKLSKVISLQRMLRREIHSLDQVIPDSVMSNLERSYSVVMQDLCETALNLSRWAERCIDRSISPEKLKQAFGCDNPTLSTSHFQNTGLDVQIDELMTAFKKVYEDVVKAKKGEIAKPAEACSVMEVRAEYEDKLNRMKAKMKQLYQEQINLYKEKQKEATEGLERELAKTRSKLEEKSKAYEEHIQGLTRELWSVGEKFLMKKEEAEWLRKKQTSSSLMSLQHVHSSGLGPSAREQPERAGASHRPSDAQSLRDFPAHKSTKSERRGFHMSDEEGEVFDNRWLKELNTTPRHDANPAHRASERISELKYRNSLCPPHLKSSYPAETQFHTGRNFHEDEIKFEGAAVERRNRKEVGITAYKKPGPPTPSKNAGRLSATDSELRESLRPEPEAPLIRKTTTPSRLRALFRSNRSDAENTGTPRSKRLSIFRSKKQ